MLINTPISVGELIDKITILMIKAVRIADDQKLQHVHNELQQLQRVVDQHALQSPELLALMGQLQRINETLWQIEDDIRLCEKAQDFSDRFVQLARSVYLTNDQRAQLKREINVLTQSALYEVKSYEDYVSSH